MTTRRVCMIGLMMTVLQGAYAQNAAPLTFEVATIRDTDPSSPIPPSIRLVGNRLLVRNMTLQEIISIAYDLNFASEQQVIGGPTWMRTERFDVTAKEEEGVAKHIHDLPAAEEGNANRELMQSLLAERFGLKVHQEQRTLTTYTLEIAKGGPKLSHGVLDPHLPSDIPQNRVNMMGVGWLEAHNTDMTLFAKTLSSQAELTGRMVMDRTGLKGRYNFTLRWTPATLTGDEDADASPSLLNALQEQLGLKLTTRKNPVNVLLVDSVERPSAN